MNGGERRRIFLVVLAGGASLRARGGDGCAPKQFRQAGGRMLFLHGLLELARAPGVACAVLVTPEAWRPLAERALEEAGAPVPCHGAPAGSHRTASTWNALQRLERLPETQRPLADDLVAVHDAARPFASRVLLARVAGAAALHGAAVPAVPVADTIVELVGENGDLVPPIDHGTVTAAYLDRARLAAVQTPQVARWDALHAAHARAAAEGASWTDDGGLLASVGRPPAVVPGEVGNWKVTTDEDWRRAEEILRRPASA